MTRCTPADCARRWRQLLEWLGLGQIHRRHTALETCRSAAPLLLVLALSADATNDRAASDRTTGGTTDVPAATSQLHRSCWCSCRQLWTDFSGREHVVASVIAKRRVAARASPIVVVIIDAERPRTGSAQDALVALKVVLRAHVVDAACLGAFRNCALLVRTMRDTEPSTPVRLVAAFDHAPPTAAVCATETSALAALRAVRDSAPAPAAMKLAEPARLRRVIAALELAPLAAAVTDTEAAALVAQPATCKATAPATAVAFAESARAHCAVTARHRAVLELLVLARTA